jgi:hypothetical protein
MPEGNENLEQDLQIDEAAIRQAVIQDFGFTEEENQDLIEKLTKERVEHKKVLSGAIRQKQDQRQAKEHYKGLLEKQGVDPKTGLPKTKDENQNTSFNKSGQTTPDNAVPEYVKKLERELEDIKFGQLNVPPELRKEIKTVAQLNNISIEQASQSDYIKFKREQLERDAKVRNSSLPAGGNKTAVSRKDFSQVTPKDFDLSSEDGRKSYGEYKEWLKRQG